MLVAVLAVAVLALGVALPAYAASVSIGGTKVDMDTAVPTKIDDSVMGDAAFQFNYKGDWSPEAGYASSSTEPTIIPIPWAIRGV